jgi:hypothetical protein
MGADEIQAIEQCLILLCERLRDVISSATIIYGLIRGQEGDFFKVAGGLMV